MSLLDIVTDIVASYQKQHCSFCCAVDMFCNSSLQHQFAAGNRIILLPEVGPLLSQEI
jgi:hypothetical protein